MLLTISAVVLFATALVTMTRQLHFLQLNSYYNRRFFDYFRNEFNMISVWSLFATAIVVNLAIFELGVATLCFACGFGLIRILYNIVKLKTAKKGIVFTARIKRFYITSVVLFGVVFVLTFFNNAP